MKTAKDMRDMDIQLIENADISASRKEKEIKSCLDEDLANPKCYYHALAMRENLLSIGGRLWEDSRVYVTVTQAGGEAYYDMNKMAFVPVGKTSKAAITRFLNSNGLGK